MFIYTTIIVPKFIYHCRRPPNKRASRGDDDKDGKAGGNIQVTAIKVVPKFLQAMSNFSFLFSQRLRTWTRSFFFFFLLFLTLGPKKKERRRKVISFRNFFHIPLSPRSPV